MRYRMNNTGRIMPKLIQITSAVAVIIVLLGFTDFLIGQSKITVTYDAETSAFANPERGPHWLFNHGPDVFVQDVYLKDNILKAKSDPELYLTMLQIYFLMTNYVNTPLDQAFFDAVKRDIDTARELGIKLIARFNYNRTLKGPEATSDWMLHHMNQLKPFLADNYDVIAFFDAGFIGSWGEWNNSVNGYTTIDNHWDDCSTLSDLSKYTGENPPDSQHKTTHEIRTNILMGLIDMVPLERQITIRWPRDKKSILDPNPLTPAEAYSGSPKSRVAHCDDGLGGDYNDRHPDLCDDWSTYSPCDSMTMEAEKDYLAQENLFLVQSGEMWGDPDRPAFSDCAPYLADMERMHWDHYNYWSTPVKKLKDQGCWQSEIIKKLGYRFRLINGTFPEKLSPGQNLDIELNLINDGWGKAYNPRGIEIVLKKIGSDKKYYIPVRGANPRDWLPGSGEHQLLITDKLSDNILTGSYNVCLFLPDPFPSLRERPDYAIRLVNKNIWDPTTGYNDLGAVINVTAKGDSIDNQVPAPKCSLYQNYPNPYRLSTTIAFDLYESDYVSLKIYNLKGECIRTLLNTTFPKGNHQVKWNGEDDSGNLLPTGSYQYKLDCADYSKTMKMLHLK